MRSILDLYSEIDRSLVRVERSMSGGILPLLSSAAEVARLSERIEADQNNARAFFQRGQAAGDVGKAVERDDDDGNVSLRCGIWRKGRQGS